MIQTNQIKEIILIVDRFEKNINRLQLILKFSNYFKVEDENEIRSYINEIHRATIVFLHASFEDILRELFRLYLRENHDEILDSIPLAGFSESGQPRKFSLGALVKFKDKTINDVIKLSIDEYLNKTSFNSSTDIANMISKMKLKNNKFSDYYLILDEMIQRRHQIVHKADLINDDTCTELEKIEPAKTFAWIAKVICFIVDLAKYIVSPKDPDIINNNNVPEIKALREQLRELIKISFLILGNLSDTELKLQKK